MKKPKRLRALSGVASLALLASYLLPLGDVAPVLTASAEEDGPVYGKPYTIENILTDFGLFSETDIIANNSGHIVGGIAVGGKYESDNAFGDAASGPSYIVQIERFSNYNPGNYISDPELKQEFIDKAKLYYRTNNSGVNANGMQQIDNDYINFGDAFKAIQDWSTDQKNTPGAWKVQASDLNDGFLDPAERVLLPEIQRGPAIRIQT